MIYPKGLAVNKVSNWDRSTKGSFHCVHHPDKVWRSKDPFASAWFPVDETKPDDCDHTLLDGTFVLSEPYDNQLPW